MSKVVAMVLLRLEYDPKLDTDENIKARIEWEFNTLMNHGHLEGCEHGAQILSHELTISLNRTPK